MTVPVNDRRIQYTATAGQTVFPYDFKIDANTEITVLQTVYLTSVTNTLTLTTEYTVSGVGDAGGGNITLVTGAAVDDTITIIANTPLSRTTDFNQAGDFLVSDLNNQLDKLTNILQENDTTINRAVKLKDEDTTSSLEIPTATNRASKFLAFDASGDAIASAGTTETTVSSFMATVLDDTTAAAARTTLDAEQKANSLTAITTLEDDDQFIVADNSDSDNSKKITLADMQATQSLKGVNYLSNPITIANNSTDADHDIDFGVGVMQFDDGTGQVVATALTKQLDATWSAGDDAGGLFTGSIAADTWYHCFAIYNPTTKAYDAGFDTSVTAANAPSGYTKYERRGSILTDSSSNILAFIQDGNTFSFNASITELDTTTTTAVSDTAITITSPLGIRTKALMRSTCNSSTNSQLVRVFVKDKSTSTDREINGCGRSTSQPRGVSSFEVYTNTSSQINYSTSLGGVGTGTYNFVFFLDGWVDYQLKS